MKNLIVSAVAILAFGLSVFSGPAMAEEVKMTGVITKIDVAGKDAKTATITLTDNKTEQPVAIIVNDDLTLDKIKDRRIVEGDEVRCKYETKDGKNISLIFKKTAGC